MPPWLRRLGVLGLVLIVILGVLWLVRPGRTTPLAAPGPGEASALDAALRAQPTLTLLPATPMQSFVFDLPDATTDTGELLIGEQPSAAMHPAALLDQPPAVADEPGIYVSVRDSGGTFIYLARVSDPRELLGERVVAGELVPSRSVSREGGVVASVVPFAPSGFVHLFEVGANGVGRVFIKVPLEAQPFPKRGKRFDVPFS